MLTAFEKQLKQLAIDPYDHFHAEIRKRIGKKLTDDFEQKLKNLIVNTPQHMESIYKYWNHHKTQKRIKKIGSFALSYLYNPKDYLSCDEYGLFGYLDDAYFVALVYERVLWDAKINGSELTRYEDEFLQNAHITKKMVQTVIPEEAAKIESMFDELLTGKSNKYYDSFVEQKKEASRFN